MSNEWAQTPTDARGLLADLRLMAEQGQSHPGIRPICPGVHPAVMQLDGKLLCMVCGMVDTPPAEQMCECLGARSLVWERDGVYHAKPGPCADKALSEAL